MYARFWYPVLKNGILNFEKPENCKYKKLIRPMIAKTFGTENVKSVEIEAEELEVMG